MIYIYLATLLLPLVLTFFLNDLEFEEQFFGFFSIAKVSLFVSGWSLAQLLGLNPFWGIGMGVFKVGCYHFGLKLLKELEYKPHKREVVVGDTGVVYSRTNDLKPGKVLIAGEIYLAVPNKSFQIESFTPIKVVGKIENSDMLIVEEL